VYGQKPLTQTIEEARLVAEAAARRRVVTQMGIQIHSHPVHRQVVATIQDRAIGRVKEVHSWSGKDWGDRNPRPERSDPVPAELRWDSWLGVAKERPYLEGYYHPGNWRKRLDFGTGTFGDMACHILDPVFTSLELRAPLRVKSKGEAPGADSWALDAEVEYLFPGTKHTAGDLKLCWYNGGLRPPAEVKNLLGELVLAGQGTIYIGTEGVLYSPYIDAPVLLPEARFEGYRMPDAGGADHYLQYVEACRGNGAASAPFSFAGPMTEAVLLGCLATRFPGRELSWDAAGLRCPGVPEADGMIRRVPRAGWEFPKIS
jgi:predicted dehydrogenase